MHNLKQKYRKLIIVSLSLNLIYTSILIPDYHSTKKIKTHKKTITNFTNLRLSTFLDYIFGYDRDDKNFLAENALTLRAHDQTIDGPFPEHTLNTDHPIVLINFHGSDELHLGTQISGPFTPGKHRSLSWTTPLLLGNIKIKSRHGIHESLALPTAWSNNTTRPYATFLIIPPHTPLTYKIGNAAPQSVNTENRPGGGIQMRLKFVPSGTILLTVPIYTSDIDSKTKTGIEGKINFEKILRTAIDNYNKTAPTNEQINKKQVILYCYEPATLEELFDAPIT